MSPPLVITADESLRDALLRLAAAAGVSPAVVAHPADALRLWKTAPVVLVGVDVAAEVVALRPARRDAVHLISAHRELLDQQDLFSSALDMGAERVVDLASSEGWLVEVLTDAGAADFRGTVIGVLGGSGGAGATTLACALGQVAAATGSSLVLDCDPLGPGVDRVLGLEAEPGFRWDALGRATGRLGATALREALPRRAGVGALSWSTGDRGSLEASAVREALSAARRGHETVVVDLPRAAGPVVDEVVARCDTVLVVVVPTLVGVASAARLCAHHREQAAPALVVRGPGADERDVARAVGAPVLVAMGDHRGVDESVDLGLGPLRAHRGALWRACRTVLDHVASREPTASSTRRAV